jgi:hypothetical protein
VQTVVRAWHELKGRDEFPKGTKLTNPAGKIVFLNLFAGLLLSGAGAAQGPCSAEVKLLLSPAEISITLAALRAKKESTGDIYFFDTDKLDLLSEGVIVRLRRGLPSDLTVKIRPLQDKKHPDFVLGKGLFKCELDLSANEANISYSLRKNLTGSNIPETGNDIYRAMSNGQRKLLSAAGLPLDWMKVKRIVDIKATAWQIKSISPSRKLALELWEWPGGKILELSTKTGSQETRRAYEELHQLAIDKGLILSEDQRSKTRMVLESLASTAPQ